MTEEDKLVWRRTALELVIKENGMFEKTADQVVSDANVFYNFLVNATVSGDSKEETKKTT